MESSYSPAGITSVRKKFKTDKVRTEYRVFDGSTGTRDAVSEPGLGDIWVGPQEIGVVGSVYVYGRLCGESKALKDQAVKAEWTRVEEKYSTGEKRYYLPSMQPSHRARFLLVEGPAVADVRWVTRDDVAKKGEIGYFKCISAADIWCGQKKEGAARTRMALQRRNVKRVRVHFCVSF